MSTARIIQLDQQDRKFLLDLARETLRRFLKGEDPPNPETVPARAMENGACFLTLIHNGSLRGCIGNVHAQESLYLSLMRNVRDAAQRDSRFEPIHFEELDDLKIEVTVLSELEPLNYSSPAELLSRLQPGKHGVVLQIGCRAATFLPQVWKMFPNKEEFMNRLSEKTGCDPNGWRGEETGVSIFVAESFEE